VIHNRVLLLLAIVLVAGAAGLPFAEHAPNRLLSGHPIFLGGILHAWRWLALLPALPLLLGPFLPQRPATHLAVAVGAALMAAAVAWVAGAEAASLAGAGPAAARTSLGAGGWAMLLVAGLALSDALRRLPISPAARAAAGLCALLPLAAVVGSGGVAELGIVREWTSRRDVFAAACLRHLEIVLPSLLATLLIGLPLGLVAQRRRGWRTPLFSALNIVQTIPSIALFGLLMAPLAGLGRLLPGLERLGIGGVGLAPAVIALTLYSLLPVARNVAAGLDGVEPGVMEAARGMGMAPRQVLWRVQAPLALPVVLSGVRIAVVQMIGLAVVAALIGAGGLGDIIFQGLFANALDLVLLGVLPVVAYAAIADAGMRLLAEATRPGRSRSRKGTLETLA
jgi:osmoprotectant transport system permease protein